MTALKHVLEQEYIVISLDFQSIDNDVFESGSIFSQGMARIIADCHEFEGAPIPGDTLAALEKLNESDLSKIKLDDLFRILKRWIKKSDKGIVLIIDEVDSATGNQVFVDFLAGLRDMYIGRQRDRLPAFQSVILDGVTEASQMKTAKLLLTYPIP